VRDAVPCYANGWFAPAKTPDEFALRRLVRWMPDGRGSSGILRSGVHEPHSAGIRQALACVEAVMGAVGDRADVLIEGHGRFNVPTAIRIGRALEPYGVLWFEEPIPPDNMAELPRCGAVCAFPSPQASGSIAAGSTSSSYGRGARILSSPT